MKIIQKLGLAGLLAAAGCGFGGEETLVQRNQGVQIKGQCTIDREATITRAVDTQGDYRFDEALVTRGYRVLNSRSYEVDNSIARATTHYVAPSLKLEQQLFTGFPDTRAMTPEYQAALGLVCRGQ